MGRRRGNKDAFVPRGKSNAEARVERMTWFFLVGIFAILSLLQDEAVDIPNWFVPLSGCVILIGSGVIQYLRHWRVSPVTWLAGALLAGLAYINLRVNPDRSFLGLSLVVFAGVILIGLLTGET